METATYDKKGMTVKRFFDAEERILIQKVLWRAINRNLGNTMAITAAELAISELPRYPDLVDFRLSEVLNADSSEGIFEAINQLWKESTDEYQRDALQDLAWKIQDYVY